MTICTFQCMAFITGFLHVTNQHLCTMYCVQSAYHLGHHLLHELGAFLHLIARSPQLHDVALGRGVREVDDHLRITKKWKVTKPTQLFSYCTNTGMR